MPDLTTYTDHPRTIPTLDAFNARREAARVAREDQKRARLAHFRQLEQAAVESQTRRPVKVAPIPRKPVEKPVVREPEREPGTPLVVPCAGPCKRPTRTRGFPLTAAPGTVPRVRNGYCSMCLKEHRPRPEVDRSELIADYQAGMSIAALKAKHHVGKSRVYEILEAKGVPRRRKGAA